MADVARLQERARLQEEFASHLEASTLSVQELLKYAAVRVDRVKERTARAERDKEDAYLECKSSAAQLGRTLGLLHEQCRQLNAALCPDRPQLMCQMPLDELQNVRKKVESDLKLLIVKQFQKVRIWVDLIT